MLVANQKVQVNATTGTGAVCSPKGQGRISTLYVNPTGTLSAGKAQFETAPEEDYAGTWAALGAELTLAGGAAQVVSVEGAHMHLRCRITTNLAGTTPALNARIVVSE